MFNTENNSRRNFLKKAGEAANWRLYS